MPHTPGGKHAAWVDRHPPLSHRRTSGTHFRVARAILSGVPLYMRLSKPNTFLEYHIVINSRGGGRPGKNGPHTNYMVKCLVFEIRTCFPVLAPKSGKQDVQTGPGQGRHLPSLLDEKIARRLPGLTTVSLRDRFWRFQPNRSSPPRVSSAILFASAGTRPPSYPPPP